MDCPACTLGVYDDAALNKNFGTLTPFVAKDLYLGVQLGAGQTGVTGLEFSIVGLLSSEVLVTAVEGVTTIAPNIVLGPPAAPADTTRNRRHERGVAELRGRFGRAAQDQPPAARSDTEPNLARDARVPVSNPNFGFAPILIGCDNPMYTPARVTGGWYVMNYDGPTTFPECPVVVAVEQTTWSAVKKLYQ